MILLCTVCMLLIHGCEISCSGTFIICDPNKTKTKKKLGYYSTAKRTCHALVSSNRGGRLDKHGWIHFNLFVVAKCAYRTCHRHITSRLRLLVYCRVCLHNINRAQCWSNLTMACPWLEPGTDPEKKNWVFKFRPTQTESKKIRAFKFDQHKTKWKNWKWLFAVLAIC